MKGNSSSQLPIGVMDRLCPCYANQFVKQMVITNLSETGGLIILPTSDIAQWLVIHQAQVLSSWHSVLIFSSLHFIHSFFCIPYAFGVFVPQEVKVMQLFVTL